MTMCRRQTDEDQQHQTVRNRCREITLIFITAMWIKCPSLKTE